MRIKKYVIMAAAAIVMAGCQQKSADNQTVATTAEETDEMICEAIADYLMGDKTAVEMSDDVGDDLFESSWPEVQCDVEGTLDSPASFNNLTVKRVAPGKYKYECDCPDHGDHYVDNYTITASLESDGTVRIEHVVLDDDK